MSLDKNSLIAVAAVIATPRSDKITHKREGVEELSQIRSARELIAQFERCDEVMVADEKLNDGTYSKLDFAKDIMYIASKTSPPIEVLERRICALYPMQCIYSDILDKKGRRAAIEFDNMLVDLIADARNGKY